MRGEGRGVLIEYFSSPDPFGTPFGPLGVQRVELGGRDERRARAQRLELFAEFRDLSKTKKMVCVCIIGI